MSPDQRRLNRNLLSHDLQRVSMKSRAVVLGARDSILWARRRNGRHILHRTDADSVTVENGISDDIIRCGLLRQGYNDAARTDDPSFLKCDLGDRIAQEFLMVERDVSNDADQRLDDVGCVEAAAHSDFEDCNVDALGREVAESDGGHHLEETGMPGQGAVAYQLLCGAIDVAVEPREIVVGDFIAVDADSFIDADEVWRGVQRSFQP